MKAGSQVRLPDLVGVGVLTAAFPPELVDLAIEQWDAREQRHRLLPARLMAYYVMACVWFLDSAYVEVWNKLLGPSAVGAGRDAGTTAADHVTMSVDRSLTVRDI